MRKLIMILLLSALIFMPAAALPEITAQPGQVNPYMTRSELLMEATDYTGVFSPEQAAQVWATGLIRRSAAMQYTVMTGTLKKEYAGQLDALRSNWVTGMSSPSVWSFTITGVYRKDAENAEINLCIETAAVQSPPEYYKAKLCLVKERPFWRISRIWTDKELYPYTLYQPEQ